MLQVPFPPDPNPRKPRFIVPPGSWDTHFHLYGPPDRFPYADERLFNPPAAPVEHWLGIAGALGIERGVTVTPGIHGSFNAVTLNAIERSEGRIVGMIRANAALTKADVGALHERGVRGMRFTFATHLGQRFDADELRASIAAIGDRGWVAAFLIDGDQIERHAEEIAKVPLPVAIDGFAGISPRLGTDQPAVRALRDVLALPHVHWKIMCPDRELHAGERYEDIVALARTLAAVAPERAMWGSDWPHAYCYEPNTVPNDGDLLGMLADFVPDEAVRRRVLADNPKALFDFR